MLTSPPAKSGRGVYDRILRSAYRLFSSRGVAQVGIDTILADSGSAKGSLYKHFGSKEDLVIAYLQLRESLWTRDWLETEVRKRASDPTERLLVVFDVFEGWFKRRDFEGCSFVNVLLESEINSPIHQAAARHLSNIRAIIRGFAQDAGLEDPLRFAECWHVLMKGSIVSAYEGDRFAADRARTLGRALLETWPREARPQVA